MIEPQLPDEAIILFCLYLAALSLLIRWVMR